MLQDICEMTLNFYFYTLISQLAQVQLYQLANMINLLALM